MRSVIELAGAPGVDIDLTVLRSKPFLPTRAKCGRQYYFLGVFGLPICFGVSNHEGVLCNIVSLVQRHVMMAPSDPYLVMVSMPQVVLASKGNSKKIRRCTPPSFT